MFNWFLPHSPKTPPGQLLTDMASPEKFNELSVGWVDFVFVLVQGATPEETGRQLGVVATMAQRNGWMIQNVLCNLVVLVNGTLPGAESQALERSALVDKLLQALLPNIRIVHGAEQATYGKMGGPARITYGILLPSFLEVLSVLSALPLGRAHEYRRDEPGAQPCCVQSIEPA